MPTTVENYETLCQAASDALAASDFATAKTKALAALPLAAAIPDSAAGEHNLRFDRGFAKTVLDAIKQALGGSTGIGRTKIVYKHVTSTEAC